LRYHYFVDVAAGFALAAFGLWIANRWEKRAAGDFLNLQPVTLQPETKQ
jgi:membrane-associated phospholipid phosphatase